MLVSCVNTQTGYKFFFLVYRYKSARFLCGLKYHKYVGKHPVLTLGAGTIAYTRGIKNLGCIKNRSFLVLLLAVFGRFSFIQSKAVLKNYSRPKIDYF